VGLVPLVLASVGAALTVALSASAADPARLVNVSTRGQVLTGNDRMIAGFVIAGTASRTVVISVTGPSLYAFGLTGLADPTLTLVRTSDQAVIATNDDWQSQSNPSDVAAIQAAGFQPSDTKEPAIIATLPPGAYTAIVEGVGGGTGTGLVGVFEVGSNDDSLVNISTRGKVLTGNDVMIAGFVVGGSGYQTVVVNVAGPALNGFGLNGLANPTLALVRTSDNALIATNDNWLNQVNPQDAIDIQASGFRPSNPLEPAIIATLSPGAYTAIVSGAGGTTGVGLVGVFTVPPPPPFEYSCVMGTAASAFTFNGQFFTYAIPKGGVASFKLPPITRVGGQAELIAFQSTTPPTPSDLQSEAAISTTCGSFNVPPACKQSGSAWSSIDLYGLTWDIGYCLLTPGTTYYVNVRNVVGGIDSCKTATCAQRLQYIGNLQ
jgi:hypothetical protein